MKHRFVWTALFAALGLAPLSASAQQVVATMAPPAPITESQPPSPGANYTWVGGYWNWNGSQYAWTAGHWEQTPAAAQGWDAPQWEREGQGYRFRPGRWRGRNGAQVQNAVQVGIPVGQMQAVAMQPAQAVTTAAPPAPIAEVQPPSPGANYAWVAGFWNWNGSQYTWTGGHWEQPPAPAQAWQAPQWEREGQGYRFRPGRWNRRDGMQQPAPVVVAQPGPVVVTQAPPRLRVERRPRPSAPGQVWVPGYWSWSGTQHVWTAGQWQNPPRPAARWVAPRWGRQGRNWIMQPGAWR